MAKSGADVEVCDRCGKAISKRARKNVWQGSQVVCTPCLRTLEGEAAQQARRDGPTTEPQRQYAAELGIKFDAATTFGQLSDAIDKAKQRQRAQRERGELRRWVYSVMMREREAAWLRHRDSGIGTRDVDKVVAALRKRHPEAVEYVRGVCEGMEPDWWTDMSAEVMAQNEDEWYWFDSPGDPEEVPDEDYPTSGSDAYRVTAALVHEILGQQLAAAPGIDERVAKTIARERAQGGTMPSRRSRRKSGGAGCGCAVLVAIGTVVGLLILASMAGR